MSTPRSTAAAPARRLTPRPVPRPLAALLAAALAAVAVLAGAGAAAAKPVLPALAFSPSPYHYGPVTVRQSASQTFTLANSGHQATGKLTVTLTGAAAFTISGNTCTDLRPGTACTVSVRFTPAAPGTVTATLIAAGNKAARAADVLTGTGKGFGLSLGNIYWADGVGITAAGLDGTSPHTVGTGGVAGVAVDASHLYWTDALHGTIWEANLDGSNPQILVSGPIGATGAGATGVAVDASHIYWSIQDDGPTSLGEIWEANLDGSSPQRIVAGQTDPYGVAVYGRHVYWANAGTDVAGTGTINEANLDGSSPHAIVSSQDTPLGIAVAGPHLYWGDSANAAPGAGSIWEANLDGSNPHAIVTSQNVPIGVAADDSHLYWANNYGQTIEQANLDGSSPQTIATIVTGLGSPNLMAVTPAPAALAFTPASFDYGKGGPGQPVSQTFTLANTGGQPTGVLTDTLIGSAAFSVTGDTCTGTSLDAGDSCTVTVQFAPASLGAFTATLTSASTNPAATATVALTGTGEPPRFLYWTNLGASADYSDGSVNEANLDGSSPQPIATSQDAPFALAVSASRIYWSTGGTTINEADLDGTHSSAVPVLGQNNLSGIAVDASHLYWTSLVGGRNPGTIWEAGLDVDSPQAIVKGQASLMGGVAVDASHLYWTASTSFSPGGGAVWEANLNGTNPQAIVTGQNLPTGVAVGGGHLYWAAETGNGLGAIWEANLDGTNPQRIATGQNAPSGVAADDSHLYWTNSTLGGAIWEANLDGSNPHTIVTGQNTPQAVAVSAP